jgi:hypothetical protein
MTHRWIGVVLVAVCLSWSGSVEAQPQPASDLAPFMEAIIDSLAKASDATAVLARTGVTDMDDIANTQIAIAKIVESESALLPFIESRDPFTSQMASVFSQVYDRLVEVLRRYMMAYGQYARLDAAFRDDPRKRDEQGLALLHLEMRRLTGDIDVAWKRVPEISGISTNLLVDMVRPDSDKRFTYLRITSGERQRLVSRLETLFDKRMMEQGGTAGQPAQIAAARIWQFLNRPGWKPSDAR